MCGVDNEKKTHITTSYPPFSDWVTILPAISFTMFKDKILSGEKRQTIRKLRKRPVMVGDKLYLFWKLRTKQCERLGQVVCTETFFIQIQFEENFLDSGEPAFRIDRLEKPDSFSCITLTENQCEELAKKDGFQNVTEMLRALTKMHGRLNGQTFQVIRW